jgi:hypothetical protein
MPRPLPESRIPDEPIETSLEELRRTNLAKLKSGAVLSVFESDFPESTIWREGDSIVVEITEHIYTKFWWHKYHAMVFAEAMQRATKRLLSEGNPFSLAEIENDDEPHIFVRWTLRLPRNSSPKHVITCTKEAYELVWQRANDILEDSDSVLLLGKDTGDSLKLLTRIKSELESLGYYVYMLKEQPDKWGESVIQKVLRHALSSKFILIENSEPSGHLYEIPHVTKMAECVTALLQEEGKGATWMFEDAYAKALNWKKFTYSSARLRATVREAAEWAEQFTKKFAAHQKRVLPWLR